MPLIAISDFSPNTLQNHLNEVATFFRNWKLKVKPFKTQIMTSFSYHWKYNPTLTQITWTLSWQKRWLGVHISHTKFQHAKTLLYRILYITLMSTSKIAFYFISSYCTQSFFMTALFEILPHPLTWIKLKSYIIKLLKLWLAPGIQSLLMISKFPPSGKLSKLYNNLIQEAYNPHH